jgi:hypothetical protein
MAFARELELRLVSGAVDGATFVARDRARSARQSYYLASPKALVEIGAHGMEPF